MVATLLHAFKLVRFCPVEGTFFPPFDRLLSAHLLNTNPEFMPYGECRVMPPNTISKCWVCLSCATMAELIIIFCMAKDLRPEFLLPINILRAWGVGVALVLTLIAMELDLQL